MKRKKITEFICQFCVRKRFQQLTIKPKLTKKNSHWHKSWFLHSIIKQDFFLFCRCFETCSIIVRNQVSIFVTIFKGMFITNADGEKSTYGYYMRVQHPLQAAKIRSLDFRRIFGSCKGTITMRQLNSFNFRKKNQPRVTTLKECVQ